MKDEELQSIVDLSELTAAPLVEGAEPYTNEEKLCLYTIDRGFLIDPRFRAYISGCAALWAKAYTKGRINELLSAAEALSDFINEEKEE